MQTVPVAPWLGEVMRHVAGETIAAIVADRYKLSELGEAIDRAGIQASRSSGAAIGFKDGNEDIERFKRACFDGRGEGRAVVAVALRFR